MFPAVTVPKVGAFGAAGAMVIVVVLLPVNSAQSDSPSSSFFPFWVIVRLQVPAETIWMRPFSVTVHTPAVVLVYLSRKPEVAVAPTAKSASPTFFPVIVGIVKV